MKRQLLWFGAVVLLGVGWADYALHDLRDGRGALEVYGWRTRQETVTGVWMGDEYPLAMRDSVGDIHVIAGGGDYNVTESGREAVGAAEVQYRDLKDRWHALIRTLYDTWRNE